jgi:flagellar basal-body rod protein FlgB
MNNISSPIMSVLEKFLDVTSQRQQLVTANIANVDTPGYQTKDLDFRGELQRAAAGGPANFVPVVRSVGGLLQRPDGNNVSMDREGLLLAETQMQFGLGVQLLHHEFQNLLMAINEGSKG